METVKQESFEKVKKAWFDFCIKHLGEKISPIDHKIYDRDLDDAVFYSNSPIIDNVQKCQIEINPLSTISGRPEIFEFYIRLSDYVNEEGLRLDILEYNI